MASLHAGSSLRFDFLPFCLPLMASLHAGSSLRFDFLPFCRSGLLPFRHVTHLPHLQPKTDFSATLA